MDSDSESSSDEQPLMRSTSVPPDVLSAWEHDVGRSRFPLTPAPREASGRVCDMHRVSAKQVEVTGDPLLPKFQGKRSQRSISSTVDASWEDPGPTLEFDLTQLDSSDDQCNETNACRNVMPRMGDRDADSSAVFPHSVGQQALIPVSGGRKSCLKAVHSGSSAQSNHHALLMDDGSPRGVRRLVLINGGGTSRPDNTQDDWDSRLLSG